MRSLSRPVVSLLALGALAPACAHQAPPRPTLPSVVVGAVDTPIDLSAGVTLERVTALVIERHPLRAAEGAGELSAQDREVHARELRHEAALAYATYLHAWRAQRTAQRHAGFANRIAGLVRDRAEHGAGDALGATSTAIDCARLDMDAAHAGWELDRARAALDALLVRPADAAIGPPTDAVARSVAVPVEDLVARATRHHPIDARDLEAPAIIRGQITEALDQLQQLEREWSVLRTEALPHEDLLRSVASAMVGGRIDPVHAFPYIHEHADLENEVTSMLAELIVGVADLEQAVGEALPTTPLGSPLPEPAELPDDAALHGAPASAPSPTPTPTTPEPPPPPVHAHPAHPAHPAPAAH